MTPSKRHSQEPREETVSAEVTPEMLLAHLATLSQPASIRQISHGMELRHRGRRLLPRVLQQLKRRGDVEEIYGGRFRLAEQKSAPGTPTSRRAARAAEPAAPSAGAPPAAPAAESGPKRARDPNLIAGR